MKPTLTLFADASVEPKAKIAGWACWIKADGQRSITVGGLVKDLVQNVVHAELIAIANGLSVAKSRGLLVGHVMIQSDCSTALCAIRMVVTGTVERPKPGGHRVEPRATITKRQWKVLKVISELSTGLEVSIRHVKGHVAKGDGRNFVNRQCDELAKRYMRERRDSLQQEGAGA